MYINRVLSVESGEASSLQAHFIGSNNIQQPERAASLASFLLNIHRTLFLSHRIPNRPAPVKQPFCRKRYSSFVDGFFFLCVGKAEKTLAGFSH